MPSTSDFNPPLATAPAQYMPYISGGQSHQFRHREHVDIGFRVQIGVLEQRLRDCEKQKAEVEIAVLYLTKVATNAATGHYDHQSGNNELIHVREKLRTAEIANESLQAQLNQATSLVMTLSTRLVETARTNNVVKAPVGSDSGVTLIDFEDKVGSLVEVQAQANSISGNAAIIGQDRSDGDEDGETVDDGEEGQGLLATNSDQDYPSLSTSWSSNTSTLPYIARFVKGKNAKKKVEELPILQKPSFRSDLSRTSDSGFQSVQRPPSKSVLAPHDRTRWGETSALDTNAERIEVIRSNRLHTSGQDPVFSDLTRCGLRYVPSSFEKNAYRTVIICNVPLGPSGFNLQELLSKVRGGTVIQAELLKTSAITKEPARTALVTFHRQDAAMSYAVFAKKYPISYHGVQAEVTLLSTPTWPIPPYLRNAIESWNYTRCFELHSIPRFSTFATLRQDLNVTPELDWAALEVMRPKKDGGMEFRFSAIKFAFAASRLFIKSSKYKGCTLRWLPDPCDKPVETLLETQGEYVHDDPSFSASKILGLQVEETPKNDGRLTKVDEEKDEGKAPTCKGRGFEEDKSAQNVRMPEIEILPTETEHAHDWETKAAKRMLDEGCTSS